MILKDKESALRRSICAIYRPGYANDGGVLWDEVLFAFILDDIILRGFVGNTKPCSRTPAEYLCSTGEWMRTEQGQRRVKQTSTDGLDVRHSFPVIKIGETIITDDLIELLMSLLDPVRITHACKDEDLEPGGSLESR